MLLTPEIVPGLVAQGASARVAAAVAPRFRVGEKVLVRNINDVGGFSTQTYIEGIFDLNPDEALIFETEIPTKCRYWNIELTDERFVAIDWINRQSTLNGRSAKLDRDGKFRAVIAATDPGVANWLDTGGQKRGKIPLDGRRRVLNDLPGRLQGHQGCLAKVL